MDSGQSQAETKTCTKCGQTKPIDAYNRNRGCRDGRNPRCRDCKRIDRKTEYAENRATITESNRQWRLAHLDYDKERHQEKYQRTKERRRKQHREYVKERCKRDPGFRVEQTLRTRIVSIMASLRTQKAGRTIALIGCTSEVLKTHIESLFYDGMTWEEYGYGPGAFQIDHIKPVGLFDLTDPTQQRQCFHYTNLQPLWYEDHLIKTLEDKRDICARKRT